MDEIGQQRAEMLAHRRDRGRRVMTADLVDDGEMLADHHLHAPGHRQGYRVRIQLHAAR